MTNQRGGGMIWCLGQKHGYFFWWGFTYNICWSKFIDNIFIIFVYFSYLYTCPPDRARSKGRKNIVNAKDQAQAILLGVPWSWSWSCNVNCDNDDDDYDDGDDYDGDAGDDGDDDDGDDDDNVVDNDDDNCKDNYDEDNDYATANLVIWLFPRFFRYILGFASSFWFIKIMNSDINDDHDKCYDHYTIIEYMNKSYDWPTHILIDWGFDISKRD